MFQDYEEISDEEIDELIEYSDTTDNIVSRYALACQVIAAMSTDLNPDSTSSDGIVDLSICKMIIDGIIEIEQFNTTIH